MKARVTYTWSNGNAVIEHHEWEEGWDIEGTWDADDPASHVYGYLESTYQADFSPVREMDTKHAAPLVSIRVERVHPLSVLSLR